ncbi:class I adenylate-forming enzyme family protein [Rhodalgimonas zhirmunskyi]|uniref:Acyl--CoA ligase n=1 Tax=Rhodalgimonas zhirmunskyi TaxID=2964767 RepID=A0AAJ1UFK2_9RHOB|nr:class I adenylate-forming enzyme family protein [Rhodoalgimonas zhirmunskyi]MDQ2095187.1 acyl--CoA ligase [Rhodoalgimonas zhirmunskyi]
MRIEKFLEEAARVSPGKLAVIDHDDRHYDWAAMLEGARQMAEALAARGVGKGDRVLIILENSAVAIATIFGASMLGAMASPVNARLTAPELQTLVEKSDASAVVFTVETGKWPAEHAAHWAGEPVETSVGSVAIAARAGAQPEPGGEEIAILLFTSGTTGTPKGAMLGQAGWVDSAEASRSIRSMTEDDLLYLALPMSHVFGLAMVLSCTKARSVLRLESRFDVARAHAALKEGVTVLPAVPQMHAHIFAYAREHGMERYKDGPLRYVSSGGAPLDPVWKREAEAFYGLPLQNGYGMTESSSGVAATRSKMGDPDCSVGLPMLGSELRVNLEAPGADPEKGVGEVEIRGTQIMKGYFRDPEATAAVMDGDWFRSGDLGRFDDEGRLHLVGRTKELIIHSGFNVYPAEVEAALTEHKGVVLAAVVGRQVEGNEEVVAFVTPAKGADLDEEGLRGFMKERVAPYKVPKRIVIADSLPQAPTGKILKAQLLGHFADRL